MRQDPKLTLTEGWKEEREERGVGARSKIELLQWGRDRERGVGG